MKTQIFFHTSPSSCVTIRIADFAIIFMKNYGDSKKRDRKNYFQFYPKTIFRRALQTIGSNTAPTAVTILLSIICSGTDLIHFNTGRILIPMLLMFDSYQSDLFVLSWKYPAATLSDTSQIIGYPSLAQFRSWPCGQERPVTAYVVRDFQKLFITKQGSVKSIEISCGWIAIIQHRLGLDSRIKHGLT